MLAPNHLTTPPLTFAAVCKMADRSVAQRKGNRPRPTLEWQGVTYVRCGLCPSGSRWHPADHFYPRAGGRLTANCKPCQAKRIAEWRARGKRPRDLRRAEKVASVEARLNGTTPPTRHRNATLAEKWNSELLDSAGGLDTPDAPVDGMNPHRTGSDPKARVAALERGRFELAHRYNPELTWEYWVKLTTKLPRGRRPKSVPQ